MSEMLAVSDRPGAMTRLGTVWPGSKLTLDVGGWAVPLAYTATQPPVAGLVAVTLTTTADTPVAGIAPMPVTGSDTVPWSRTPVGGKAGLVRVSSSRVGVVAVRVPGVVGVPVRK